MRACPTPSCAIDAGSVPFQPYVIYYVLCPYNFLLLFMAPGVRRNLVDGEREREISARKYGKYTERVFYLDLIFLLVRFGSDRNKQYNFISNLLFRTIKPCLMEKALSLVRGN